MFDPLFFSKNQAENFQNCIFKKKPELKSRNSQSLLNGPATFGGKMGVVTMRAPNGLGPSNLGDPLGQPLKVGRKIYHFPLLLL